MLSFAEALTEAAEAAWAYTDVSGQLRCPDCNSNAEHLGEAVFHEVEAHGAVIVTTELCSDCGVVLQDDSACPPWTLRTPLESCWWGDEVTA